MFRHAAVLARAIDHSDFSIECFHLVAARGYKYLIMPRSSASLSEISTVVFPHGRGSYSKWQPGARAITPMPKKIQVDA
jgi:hypothetical protein